MIPENILLAILTHPNQIFSIWEGHEEPVIALGAISDMVVSMTKSREEQSILPSGDQLCQERDRIIYTEISSIFFPLS